VTARRKLEPLYTPSEVAERHGVTARTVREWVALGKLPGSYRRYRRICIPKSALDAFERKAPRY
jgi:excisionase family DNA binding protein